MTTQKIERIKDIREGDKVKITYENSTITGTAVERAGGRIVLPVTDNYDVVLLWGDGTLGVSSIGRCLTIEREVPDLPTEPGFYLDATGDCWELQSDGKWFPFGSVSVPRLTLVETYAPFTRLVPEGSEAKRIAKWLIQDRSYTDTNQSFYLKNEGSVSDAIARGVWKETEND